MSALAWTLRVTVSRATKVPAPGVKRTVRGFDWAAGEDPGSTHTQAGRGPAPRVGLVDSTSGSCLTLQPVSSPEECRASGSGHQ